MLNYGWFVVFCCFWLNVFQAGIAFCGGILLNTLAEEFQETRARVSLVSSVFCGVYLCTSPISDGLVRSFGLRNVCVLGCVIATTGFTVSIYSSTLNMMIFTQGVIGGFGIGLTYLPSIVAPNFYFNRQKAVAYGIGICGQGLGYAMVPLLADYVLFCYGWRDVCALFSFFCSVSTIFGFFLLPPNCCCNGFIRDSMDVMGKEMENDSGIHDIEELNSLVKEDTEAIPIDIYSKEKNSQNYRASECHLNKFPIGKANITQRHSSDHINNLRKNKSEGCLEAFESLMSPYKILKSRDVVEPCHSRLERKKVSIVSCIDTLLNPEQVCMTAMERRIEDKRLSVLSKEVRLCRSKEMSTLLGRDEDVQCPEVFYQQKIDSREDDDGVLKNNIAEFTHRPSRLKLHIASVPQTILSIISTIFKFSLFKNPSFVLFCISNVMLFMALNIPFSYGPDMMVQRGIVSEEKGSNFNMAIGFTSMVSMPAVGILVDFGPKLNPLVVTFMSMVSAGLSMFVFTMTWNLLESLVVAIWFGISFSAFLSLPPIILENILGKENVPSAYGLLVFIRGISISIGPPLAGLIYDATNNYYGSFFFAGLLFATAGLPVLVIYLINVRREHV